MTREQFDYEDFLKIRADLLQSLHQALQKEHREFLVNFKKLTPDWTIYDLKKFPAVQWKLQNIENLKSKNPNKYQQQLGRLDLMRK